MNGMWELDHKEGWAPNWRLLNCGAGEDSWESLGQEGIKPVSFKEIQCWIVTRRTDAETPILWPPDAKSQPIGKDPDAGKDWGQEEEWVTEDEMVGWHHRLNGHESGQTPGDGEGQGGLASCSQPMGSQRVGHDWASEQQLFFTSACLCPFLFKLAVFLLI